MPAKGEGLVLQRRIEGATGAILAGGAGKRLGGVRKAFIEVGGKPLVEGVRDLFSALFDETLLIANESAPYEHLGLRIVGDEIPGKGAPGGLHAALEAASNPWVFLVACDMPFLDAALIDTLAELRTDADAVLCRSDGRPQTTHAFYGAGCRPHLDRLLADGNPSFRDLLALVRVREMASERLAALDPDGRAFMNVNTPEDLARIGGTVPKT